MKISQVTIHNFRGIRDQKISLNDYSLLIGANNAGKSSVIAAIQCFYEKDIKFNKDRDFPFSANANEESWVEIEYTLDETEVQSLKKDYRLTGNRLRLRKYFIYNGDNKACKDGHIVAVSETGKLHEESFYGAKNVQSGKIGSLIFVPAVSKVEDHTKMTGRSELRDLITGIIGNVVESNDDFKRVCEEFESVSESLKTSQTKHGHSLSGFEDDVNEMLAYWGTKFKLYVRAPNPGEIVKNLTHFEFTDPSCEGQSLDSSQFGSGWQRYFIFTLINVGAKYVTKTVSKKTKDFVPDMTLLLFEEPEAFLHPPQQEQLADSLRKWTSNNKNMQVLCSTHSPHFVSKDIRNITDLIRLERDHDGNVSCHQISDDKWKKIADTNQYVYKILQECHINIHEDDLKQDMELVKQCLWMNPTRCIAFFAKHVLLVEGPTEVGLINRLLSDGLICSYPSGIVVVDSMGKYNIARFMNLFSALGIRHSVLHDDDHDNKEHKKLNELIKNSCNEHTVGYQTIRGSLEKLLGIGPPTKKHRKPQHVLYQYEKGLIPEKNLQALCTLVRSCLPVFL